MNWKKAIKAGIAPRHIAAILGVSRVTGSNYLNGHTEPHRLLEDKVIDFLIAVGDAAEAGDLPPPRDLKGPEFDAHIVKVVRKQLKLQGWSQ